MLHSVDYEFQADDDSDVKIAQQARGDVDVGDKACRLVV